MSNNQLVRYRKDKFSFEIITKPGSVRLYRSNKLSWDKVLVAEAIFINSKKGTIAKDSDLVAVFGTSDVNKCAQIIVKEGDAQVSSAERKEDMEKHRKAVLGYIHSTYLDASNRPHPLSRLETLPEQAKVRLDPNIPVQKQADEIVKKMQGVLVFKKGTVEYTLSLGHAYAKKCTGVVYKYCANPKDSWDAVGCTWKLEIAPREFDSFLAELNKITQGDFTLTSGTEKTPELPESKIESGRKKKKKLRKRDKKNHRQ